MKQSKIEATHGGLHQQKWGPFFRFRGKNLVLDNRNDMLVGGAITILKNISQWEGLSHILWT